MHDKRILVLSPWGLGGGYSGPLTLLDRLCSALSARGTRVDVAYRDRGEEIAPPWVSNAISLGDFARFGRPEQIRWGLAARRLLRAQAQDYDAIHLHGFYLANQVAVLGMNPKTRVIAMPVLDGGDLPDASSRQSVKAIVARRALASVADGLALSDGIRADFVGLGMPEARVHRVGNPADDGAFRVGRGRSQRHESPVIGFVGKVGGFKNPDVLLKALASLRGHRGDISALFVGPFENEDTRLRLESLVAELDLHGTVEFTGFTREVSDYLAQMDVFVLPSSREGLPGALCEAMAAGLPCVVSPAGSMGFHVQAAGAGLVVDVDEKSVAAGIEKALSPSWKALSHKAHNYAVDHFSADAIASTYLHAIETHKELRAHG